jgi:leader peptidase (prepilin peptidase) / N-methyltransferase
VIGMFLGRVPLPSASFGGALVGLVLGFLLAPLVSVLTTRPPLLDAKEMPGLPFRCDACRTKLSIVDAVPILSFVLRKGKCGTCRANISRWDLGAEVLSVIICTFVGWRVGVRWDLPAHLLVAAVGATVILVDARLHKIATRLIYPASAALAVLLALATFAPWNEAVSPGVGDLVRAIAGGIAASAFIWLLVLIMPTGMGEGDARLLLLLGMLLGWHGWSHVYLGIFAGFALGSLFGLLLIVTRRGGLKTQIAFGPYLVLGALILALWPSIGASFLNT